MGKTQIKSRNKKAVVASMDLLLSFIIIISILLPILNYTGNITLYESNKAKDFQKLSTLIQISEIFYTDLATKKSPSPHPDKTFSHFGIISDDFNPNSNYDFSHMGLSDFSVYSTPPRINSPTQLCIKRLMQDSNRNAKPLWFCSGD